MSLRNIFDSISDFNLVLIIYVLIGVGIFFMFSYVIKVVKFIKTDKIHDTAKEKKLRQGQLEEGLDRNNKEK